MLPKKEEILNKSGINRSTCNTKIYSHLLDEAIKDVCTSYKSALTNMRNGNIKHFRIRYQKKTKKQKILKLEQLAFSKNGMSFCSRVLGKKVCTNDGSDFTDVKNGGTILYNSNNNRFTLLVPEEIEVLPNEQQNRHKFCAFDVGLKELLTGYSTDHVLGIAPEFNKKITVHLKQIDEINKSTKLTNAKKKHAVGKRNNKISNLVDDLQWKVANYITRNYETVLIGNMSTKNIVSNKGNLNKMTKRVAMVAKIYVFRERIKNRCFQNNCQYKLVDEHYSTKMCSHCGNIKEDVGNSRIYKCTHCNKTIGRDINGGRNIMMLGILDH